MRIIQKVFIFLITIGFVGQICPKGRVIILTGTQSCGKSAISKSLQKFLFGSKVLQIDNFVYNEQAIWAEKALKEKYNREKKFARNNPDLIQKQFSELPEDVHLEIPEEEEKVLMAKAHEKLFKEINSTIAIGGDVICDTILDDQAEMDMFKKKLSGVTLQIVLVYCPIEELEKRVAARNVSGRMGEKRSLEGALEYFISLYKFVDAKSAKSLGIVSKGSVDKIFAKKSNKLDEEFKEEFINKMGLKSKNQVGVVPVLKYDLIVDNGAGRTAQQCAREIKKALPKKSFWDYVRSLPGIRAFFAKKRL